MAIGIGTSIAAGFGKGDQAPKPVFLPGTKGTVKPLGKLSKGAITDLDTGSAAARDAFNAGTAKQSAILGDQEGVVRQLLARRMGSTPEQLLRSVGETAFSFIDPNVVAPLARFDVTSDRLMRMARGLNPAAVDSTAQRLRDSRIASGRYYDTARQIYGQLPALYNQVFNAGVTNDEMAAGYLPGLMSAYRRIDRAPLDAALLRSEAADAGAGTYSRVADAIRRGVYGYQQPTNWADKLGKVDLAMRDSLQDAINMASQVYGMVGGVGGMGGGQAQSQPRSAPTPPAYIPAPAAIPYETEPPRY